MKRKVVAHAFALLAIIYVTGCASPRAQWAVARSGLTEAENALVAANRGGALPDKDFVATERFIAAVRAALAEADAELKASNDNPTPRARFYLNLANATLAKLKNPPKFPTTQPAMSP